MVARVDLERAPCKVGATLHDCRRRQDGSCYTLSQFSKSDCMNEPLLRRHSIPAQDIPMNPTATTIGCF